MIFFFQAEDGIRDLVRSRGLGDVYKRQDPHGVLEAALVAASVTGAKQLFFYLRDDYADLHALSLIHI